MKEGKTFNNLTSIERLENSSNNKVVYSFRCKCGNITKAVFTAVKKGHIKSCGCSKGKKPIHGLKKHPLYNTYRGIISRCSNIKNPGYIYYGGRGIKCKWDNIFIFINDMYSTYIEHCNIYGKSDTEIDRIDVNGDYCKENCRWVTNKINCNNRRNTIFVYGLPLTEYCKNKGLKYSTISARIHHSGKNIYDSLY